jgi:hypothetical protein
VFFPEGAPWLQDYIIDELLAFDAGAHDDCVDSTTQALNYLRDKASDGFLRWLQTSTAKQEAARARSNRLERGDRKQESGPGGSGASRTTGGTTSNCVIQVRRSTWRTKPPTAQKMNGAVIFVG